jgi:hypothetical protein
MSKASAEKQTEQELLSMAFDYLNAPDLNLSGDAPKTRNVTGTFKLMDRHIPALREGEYTLTLTQHIEGDGISTGNSFEKTQKIKVVSPNDGLKPQDIFSVFPPEDSTGDHSHCLPHIVFKRSTLPWEKIGFDGDVKTPWLALVLLDETETDATKVLKPGDKIMINTVLLPKNNLGDLVHAVKRVDETEMSIIMGHRMPRHNATSVAHLVALDEERFPDGAIPDGEHEFTSLYNWRFACAEPEKQFEGILNNVSSGLLKLPATKDNTAFNTLFAKGFTPLPHFMRRGTQSVSWYRSPLVPVQKIRSFKFNNINSSDDLLRFDKETKMLDATYAAAWELGRMLTLEEKDVASSIYNYKRSLAQQNKQSQPDEFDILMNDDDNQAGLPDDIKVWLNNLLFLKPIPFNYLVPYEQMLPHESIRFFMLDKKWVQCLLDGAMSIGRIFDMKDDRKKKVTEEIDLNWSGFILRSEVVASYPDLEIMSDFDEPVQRRRLGSDVIMCIFKDKKIDKADVFLKPEGVHFGFSKIRNNHKIIIKEDSGRPTEQMFNVQFENRMMNIDGLKFQLEGDTNSADLALQLMMLPKKVRFNAKG